MTRFPARASLFRIAFLAVLGTLVCASVSPIPGFGQRIGGRIGIGSGRVGPPRFIPPRIIAPGPFPRRFIYPLGPIAPTFISPTLGFWGGAYYGFGIGLGFNPLSLPNCGLYGAYGCAPFPPYYLYGAYGAGQQLAQLYLTDGTVYNVTDYWLVDNQLHFTTIEENGTKVVEHTIPFGQLDLQKSIDVNTRNGFRFVLRNEPIDQYLRDHPDLGVPRVPQPAQRPPQ